MVQFLKVHGRNYLIIKILLIAIDWNFFFPHKLQCYGKRGLNGLFHYGLITKRPRVHAKHNTSYMFLSNVVFRREISLQRNNLF